LAEVGQDPVGYLVVGRGPPAARARDKSMPYMLA